jgi:hypothetical protein
MSCPDHQTISAFVDSELEAAQAADVQRHVGKCASCRQFVEEMQWLVDRGRAALGAIHVEDTITPNIVWWRPLWLKWARPLSLAAAAGVVLALSIWTWFASSHFSLHQAPSAPDQIASDRATPPGTNGQSQESEDIAFAQWAAPYRELHIPLVSMEVAESYNPPPILPLLLEDIERNR